MWATPAFRLLRQSPQLWFAESRGKQKQENKKLFGTVQEDLELVDMEVTLKLVGPIYVVYLKI